MLTIGIRLVAYRDDRITRLRDHAAGVTIIYRQVYMITPQAYDPAPVILVTDIMGYPGLHVKLPALGHVIDSELIHDLPLPVGLPEITPIHVGSGTSGAS